MDDSPAIWQNEDSLHVWQLKITEKHIHFQENPQGVLQVYTYHTLQKPVLTYEGISTTRKSHIKIFVLPEKKGKKSEVIILQDEKPFYGFLQKKQ